MVDPPRPDPASRPDAKRPALTLRVVISALTALIVLIVAAATFSITYTQGLRSSEELGRRLTTTLATAAMIRIEERFNVAPRALASVAKQAQREGAMLPSDAADDFAVLDYYHDVLLATFMSIEGAALAVIFMDDGSTVNFQRIANATHPDIIWTYRGSSKNVDPAVGCCHDYRVAEFDVRTMRRYETSFVRNPVDNVNRIPAYQAARSLLRNSPTGIWQNVIYFDLTIPTIEAVPTVRPLRNQSDVFIGVAAFTLSLSGIDSFLRTLDGTPGTEIVAVDSPGSVVSSTFDSALTQRVVSTTTSVSLAGNPPPHCASTFQVAPPGSTEWSLACRPLARDFPFAPLRAVAGDRAVMRPAAGTVRIERVDNYFVAGAGIANEHNAFPLSILVFVPEDDVLGDVYAARNIALAVVAAIFVAACALSFAVIALVLRPLQVVSRNMTRTARLREVSEAEEAGRSGLREVYDLQSAYSGMNTAMKSFTRYVPRDVVKDLMASGQLCEIAMKPLWCTMLFSDIAGFTSMCERVPHDELSSLVSRYFGSMSAIVMRHGGTIDKYIGDCIMAVWGAPFAIGNQEARATLCAALMELEARSEELGGAFDAAGEHLAIRVGVATGSVLAGNMGSAERMNYTVIGDDVNLAARLEALNKQFGTRVMVAESTARGLPAGVFALRQLHRIVVVGKETPVGVFEVLGLREGALNAAVLTKLRQNDDECQTDHSASFSDTMSAVSISSAELRELAKRGEDHDMLRERQPMAKLLEDAFRNKSDCIADARVLARATRHESALEHFSEQRFAECVAALRAPVPADVSSRRGTGTTVSPKLQSIADELDLAGQRLLDQAEQQLASPDRDGVFVPVWRATEK